MRARWILLALLLVALDVYLLAFHWQDVAGNIEAQFVIVTPAFVAHHVLMRRRMDRQHEQRLQEDHARHLDTQAHLQAMGRKVGELHALHIEGQLPDRFKR